MAFTGFGGMIARPGGAAETARLEDRRRSRALYVEEIIALARLSRSDAAVVSDLAQAVLVLIEQLRDVSLRADLAEATLEVELKRIGDLRHKIAGFRGTDPQSLSLLLHELAEMAQR